MGIRPFPLFARRMVRYWGLTFGEMLIVLAVFMVLAVVFIFASHTAMVKTKRSAVLGDQKALALALNEFEAENSQIPTDAEGFSVLRRTYLAQLPKDPFNKQTDGYQYFSHLSDRFKWVVVSVGPDGVPNLAHALRKMREERVFLSGASQGIAVLMTNAEAERLIREYSYDPTNGSSSSGDIITRYGQ